VLVLSPSRVRSRCCSERAYQSCRCSFRGWWCCSGTSRWRSIRWDSGKPLKVAEVEVTLEGAEVVAVGTVAVVNDRMVPYAVPSVFETIAQ
jgi:hypothetical protein